MKFDSSTLIDALVLDPLRARGLLSSGPSDKATPERLVELAVERLAQQAKEIERLREVNAKVMSPDNSPTKLADALTSKWKLLALDEVAQRADTLAAAVAAAITTYARTSL